MATVLSAIVPGSVLTASAAVYYTSPALPATTKTAIKNLSLCNTSASAVAVTVWINQDGAGAPAAKDIIQTVTLSPAGTAGSTFIMGAATHAMNAGATLQASAGTAGVVSIKATGLVAY